VKKSIAIIGAGIETGAAIADKLNEDSYRLLLVQNGINNKSQIEKNIRQKNLRAEVEIVDCAKEGCWEADIIVLAIPFRELKEIVEKINEVVTQKIVVIISDEKESSFSFNKAQELKELLPYSKIVTASYNHYSLEPFIISKPETIPEL
jgi:predicted dinucleotide-binding enzyme